MAEWLTLATLDELAEGERIALEIDGTAVLLLRHAGEIFCVADVCSHDDSPLGDAELDEACAIVCPRHGARFDLHSGKALCLPAVSPIAVFPVTVNGNEIQIRWG
jgi:3-phenylpropionate/trans-cinnamate dioxygenase ferredoxin subunit